MLRHLKGKVLSFSYFSAFGPFHHLLSKLVLGTVVMVLVASMCVGQRGGPGGLHYWWMCCWCLQIMFRNINSSGLAIFPIELWPFLPDWLSLSLTFVRCRPWDLAQSPSGSLIQESAPCLYCGVGLPFHRRNCDVCPSHSVSPSSSLLPIIPGPEREHFS